MDSRATLFAIAFIALLALMSSLYYTNNLPTIPRSNETFDLDADGVTAASVGAEYEGEFPSEYDDDDSDAEMLQ